jgi:hypothetical protein
MAEGGKAVSGHPAPDQSAGYIRALTAAEAAIARSYYVSQATISGWRRRDGVEIGHRFPFQNLGGAVERNVQQVLDFLSGAEIPPLAREFRDTRHVGQGDDTAILGADAGLALSLERRACMARVCGGRGAELARELLDDRGSIALASRRLAMRK